MKEDNAVLFDSHTHTAFSFDGSPDATPRAMCEAALHAGLSGIALTDHFEVNNVKEQIYEPFQVDDAFTAASEAKKEFEGRLRVSCGIELGQAAEYPEEARAFLAKHKYDFVLASTHNLPKVPDFYFFRFESIPDPMIDNLFLRALDETEKLCDFDGIHALAHLTYMHRYVAYAKRTLDFSKHKEHFEAIFRKMVRKDLALEINVSLLRHGSNLLMPTRELIELYIENGGALFTVGSDAHTLSDVGANISDAYELLRALSVPFVAFYENGKPALIPI